MKEKEFLIKSGIKTIVRGGEFYIQLKDVFHFLAFCDENELAVIGIEGFRLEGKYICPLMELMAEYYSDAANWKKFREFCNKAARSFFGARNLDDNSLVFCFTLLPREEWSPPSAQKK